MLADRIRELEYIIEELDSIVNVEDADGAYVDGVSRVALAGYSMGATTAQFAAGQVMRANGSMGTVVDLTTEGLRRVRNARDGLPNPLSFMDCWCRLEASAR